MADWLDRLKGMLSGQPASSSSRLFRRNVALSGPVQIWFNESGRTEAQRVALAEALLRLDSNPVGDGTSALFGPGRPAGLRTIGCSGVRVVYLWDPSRDAIKVLKCVHAPDTA